MASTSYSGAWLRNAYKDPLQAVLHTADPAHATVGQTDQGPDVTSAPALTEAAPNGEYPGSEWLVQTSGVVLNATPEDHTQGAPAQNYASELDMQTASSLAHNVDQGGVAQSNYYPRPLAFYDEQYQNTRDEGLDSQPVNEVALRRGLNGDPENNPDGFRRGYDFSSWVFRKFNYVTNGQRQHDMHVLTPNTVTEIPNQAPVISPYMSPFTSQARAMTRTWSLPSVRREPPPMDTWSQTDGQDSLYASYQAPSEDWVVS